MGKTTEEPPSPMRHIIFWQLKLPQKGEAVKERTELPIPGGIQAEATQTGRLRSRLPRKGYRLKQMSPKAPHHSCIPGSQDKPLVSEAPESYISQQAPSSVQVKTAVRPLVMLAEQLFS